MKKFLIFLSLVLTLGGCAAYAPSVPENYKGPLATVKDSSKKYSASKIDLFYLKKIDGKKIEDSRSRTLIANSGKGFYISPVIVSRKIPAKLCTVMITGRTEYAAPILALTGKVYEVSGEVEFYPEEDKTYIVKGELTEKYSSVWIEDVESKRIVGNKVEVKGSAALGFFQK